MYKNIENYDNVAFKIAPFVLDPYGNFTCQFLCKNIVMELEHFHLRNFYFTYEMGTFSQTKSLIHM